MWKIIQTIPREFKIYMVRDARQKFGHHRNGAVQIVTGRLNYLMHAGRIYLTGVLNYLITEG
jgi:hypothetical protein